MHTIIMLKANKSNHTCTELPSQRMVKAKVWKDRIKISPTQLYFTHTNVLYFIIRIAP